MVAVWVRHDLGIDAICCGRRLLDLFQAYSFIDLLLTRVEVKRTAK